MPGCSIDMPHLRESGADGIGLFRTELQFMVSATLPRLERQDADVPRRSSAEAGDKPVVFRTLDIGGDKVLPYLRQPQEENPAHGLARRAPGARPAGAAAHAGARAAARRGRA